MLFIAIGLCEALSFLIQFHAFWYVEIAYVVAIKRLSLLLSIIYGRVFFQEKQNHIQLSGAALMILGAILISFAG
jgi:uncharacterized membrane protein